MNEQEFQDRLRALLEWIAHLDASTRTAFFDKEADWLAGSAHEAYANIWPTDHKGIVVMLDDGSVFHVSIMREERAR